MYVEIIIGIILIYVALRALITENRVSKLLYLNVIGFGVPALIALVIKTPFAFVVAAAFSYVLQLVLMLLQQVWISLMMK